MTPAQTPQRTTLTGLEKTAILMVTLGEQASAEILKQLSEEEIQQASKAVAQLQRVPPELAERVLLEFSRIAEAGFSGRGGFDFAGKMLTHAFGLDTAQKLLERLPRSRGPEAAHVESLRNADPQQLAQLLQSEHPQTIAIVLSRLKVAHAAELLRHFSSTLRRDVTMRMATLDQLSPEVVQRIVAFIGHKMKSLGELGRESFSGVRTVAEILNSLDSTLSASVLNEIEEQDTNLAEAIRHYMFVFEDLLMLDTNAMKEILSKIDRKLLIVALKGTSEQLRNHFMQCMSQRGAEMLREDMEAAGPVRIREVEVAQQKIIAVVRQMEAQGQLSLKGGGGDGYVV